MYDNVITFVINVIECFIYRDKPLHLNIWTKDRSIIDEFVSRTSSGGVSVNDALIFRVGKSHLYIPRFSRSD